MLRCPIWLVVRAAAWLVLRAAIRVVLKALICDARSEEKPVEVRLASVDFVRLEIASGLSEAMEDAATVLRPENMNQAVAITNLEKITYLAVNVVNIFKSKISILLFCRALFPFSHESSAFSQAKKKPSRRTARKSLRCLRLNRIVSCKFLAQPGFVCLDGISILRGREVCGAGPAPDPGDCSTPDDLSWFSAERTG